MKKLKISIPLVFNLFLNVSFAQNEQTNLDINQLSVGLITYQTSIKEMNTILGKPLSHKKIDDPEGEYGDTPAFYDNFNYNDIAINYIKYEYMDKKRLNIIRIKSDRHSLKINDQEIKIGNSFLKVKNILPYEYNDFLDKHVEMKEDKKYYIIGGNLRIDDIEPSNIVFTIKNKKIIDISIGFPR